MRENKLLKNMGGLWICGMAALLLCGCAGKKIEDELVVVESSNDTSSFEFVTVQPGDVVLTQKIPCTYRQQNDEEISFALTGRIVDKVYVTEGQAVKKGDLLAELSVGNLERQIEDMEYWIARNELQLEYIKENEDLDVSEAWVNHIYNHYPDKDTLDNMLEDIHRNYRYQREDSEDALELDRQKLAQLKQELQYSRLYAGMDGVVYKLKEDLARSTSMEDEVIMTILDNSECLFETEAPEYASCFREGEQVYMKVNVGAANGDYQLLPYNIPEWGEKQQFSVLDGPMTSGIEVGTNGNIQFVLESRTQVLCVPTLAVHNAGDKYYVYVMDENDVRQIRWVEIGLKGDEMIEITSGLEAGEKVIRK